MLAKHLMGGRAGPIGAGCYPHVAAVSPVPSKLNIVGARLITLAHDSNEFMRRSVECSHRAGLLVPNDEVQKGQLGCKARTVKLVYGAPIHEAVQHSAADQMRDRAHDSGL